MKRLSLVAMLAVAFVVFLASFAEAKVSHFVLAGTPYASYVKSNGERVTFEVTWEYFTSKTGQKPVQVVSEVKKVSAPKVAMKVEVSKTEKKAASTAASIEYSQKDVDFNFQVSAKKAESSAAVVPSKSIKSEKKEQEAEMYLAGWEIGEITYKENVKSGKRVPVGGFMRKFDGKKYDSFKLPEVKVLLSKDEVLVTEKIGRHNFEESKIQVIEGSKTVIPIEPSLIPLNNNGINPDRYGQIEIFDQQTGLFRTVPLPKAIVITHRQFGPDAYDIKPVVPTKEMYDFAEKARKK